MAWSSLSSNEIPTKSEVQEAINSAGFEVWRGKSYIANKMEALLIYFITMTRLNRL